MRGHRHGQNIPGRAVCGADTEPALGTRKPLPQSPPPQPLGLCPSPRACTTGSPETKRQRKEPPTLHPWGHRCFLLASSTCHPPSLGPRWWEAVSPVPRARLSWSAPHSTRLIHRHPRFSRNPEHSEGGLPGTSCFPLGFTSPNHQHVGGPRLLLLSAHRGSQEL